MGEDVTFNVRGLGQPLPGFTEPEVSDNLAKLLKTTPEKALKFVQTRGMLRRGLTETQAQRYQQRLQGAGLAVDIERIASAATPAGLTLEPVATEPSSDEVVSPPAAAPAAQTLALEPLGDSAPDANQSNPASTQTTAAIDAADTDIPQGQLACPKCGAVQPQSDQCISCGVFFHKLQTTDAIEVPGKAASDTEADAEELEAAPAGFDLRAMGAAAVVALLGAWAWQLIAVGFETEWGVVAWAIGGAVGFAAASLGANGNLPGVVCAALVLLAILGGKYMATHTFFEQSSRELYELEISEAQAYIEEVRDEQSMRNYIVTKGYAYTDDPSEISAAELADFRVDFVPNLVAMGRNPPSYENWRETDADDVITLVAVVYTLFSLRWMDLLFLFLGMGTAFRLARGD